MSLFRLGYKVLSKEETEDRDKKKEEECNASAEARAAAKIVPKRKQREEAVRREVENSARTAYLNKKRQQAFRDRKKRERQLAEENNGLVDDCDSDLGDVVDRNGPLPIVSPTSYKRPDWYSPMFWNDIVVALKNANFNSRKAAELLRTYGL